MVIDRYTLPKDFLDEVRKKLEERPGGPETEGRETVPAAQTPSVDKA